MFGRFCSVLGLLLSMSLLAACGGTSTPSADVGGQPDAVSEGQSDGSSASQSVSGVGQVDCLIAELDVDKELALLLLDPDTLTADEPPEGIDPGQLDETIAALVECAPEVLSDSLADELGLDSDQAECLIGSGVFAELITMGPSAADADESEAMELMAGLFGAFAECGVEFDDLSEDFSADSSAVSSAESSERRMDCADGDLEACDELWLMSPVGSADELFGSTCGDTTIKMFGSCAMSENGPEAQPVFFAPGETGVNLDTGFARDVSYWYELSAAEGQLMTVFVDAEDEGEGFASVETADGEILVFEQQSSTLLLPETGFYYIRVFRVGGDVSAVLSIDISTPIDVIALELEADITAQVNGGIVRGDVGPVYLVGGVAGSVLSLAIESLEDNAVFSVHGPNGVAVGGDSPTEARVPLDDSGFYMIIVGSIRGNASYTLSAALE
jgi:hypothetical protein